MARSITAVIGATNRQDGYNGCIVTWCVGHLAGLVANAYDPSFAKWRYEDLPIIPESWRLTVDKREQFDTLRTFLRSEEVSKVVNACDAGREGEWIFRQVYHLAGCTKPMKRLWISSMEDSVIREGFANLKPGRDCDPLHQSALCRTRADWLPDLFILLRGFTVADSIITVAGLNYLLQKLHRAISFEATP